MKKVGYRATPTTYSTKLWLVLALLMLSIYFGGLLANPKGTKNINMEEELYAPFIALVKTGVAMSLSGRPDCDVIEYVYTVTNEGTEIMENVRLTDDLILGGIVSNRIEGDTNNDDRLDLDEIWIYTAIYDITADDIINGQVANNARVFADVQGQPGVVITDLSDDDIPFGFDPTVVDLSFCQGIVSVIKTGTLAIDGFGQPDCDLALYTFQVTNESAFQVLENVVLNDPLLGGDLAGPQPASDLVNVGFLDPGETWTYGPFQYNIQPADIANGQVDNEATVTSNVQGLPSMIVTDQSETTIDLSGCQPGIYAIKTGQALDFSGAPGCDVIRYTIEVVNSSFAIPLDNVSLSDPLISDIDLPGPDSEDINTNGILEPGETWTYIAQYTIEAEDIANGFVENRATVTADVQGQPGVTVSDFSDNDSPTENQFTVVDLSACQPGIYAIKTGQAVSISGGPGCDLIQYTIEVVNSSWIYSLDTVVLTDPLFGEDPIIGPDMNQDVGNDGVLDPGESWTYTLQHDITDADIVNGQVVNQAEVVANVQAQPGETVSDLSDNDSPTEDEHTVVDLTDCQPSIRMIKTGQVSDCNIIQYSFAIANTSTHGEVLENVVVSDPLFGGAIAGPNPGTDQGSDNLMDPGEIWTYTAFYDIMSEDIQNGQVVNQAIVTARVQGRPGITTNDLSDESSIAEDDPTVVSLTHCPIPELGLIKEGSVTDLNGDGCLESILYTFTLANTGELDLHAISVEDPLLGGQISDPIDGTDINDDGILSVGETWTYEALYSITQQDIDNIFVENHATATGYTDLNMLVQDLSDNDSYAENDATETTVPNDACIDGGFEIFNGITPNGDAMNDYFRIEGIENYPDNNVKIFNRWGVLVYESDNYGQDNNLFYGISEGRATPQKDRELPSGTYFYILTITGENPGKANYSGYLYINRD